MKMNEVRDFLHQEIPLAASMGIEVLSIDENNAKVKASLVLNDNHIGTAFGGSMTALLITSCYTWLFYHLSQRGYSLHVLIKRGETEYHFPAEEDLLAVCDAPSKEEWEQLMESFRRKGRARIIMKAYIETKKGKAATFSGEFVVKKT